MDFKFQEALRVRFPGSPQSRAAPRVPRSGIPFSDYTLLSEKSLSGTTRSRMQQGWGRRGWVGWRGAFQSLFSRFWQPASRAQVALALPGLMVLSFQRPPDTPITGLNLSLGRPVSSGLPGEWL